MPINVTHTSPKYIAGTYSYRRYIKKDGRESNLYRWCEVDTNERRLDVRQGTATGDELPEMVKKACDNYVGAFYASEWPL